ncbi:MAG: hypothetical protein GX964_04805 [Syntrophomonadaceae bacterium]|jgi:hypothetical protein|nr:hypothetical protein [Syntrophomonadaceae bacterium]
MDKGKLTQLAVNILFQLTSPNSPPKINVPNLVSILSLVNLMGIVEYYTYHADESIPPMVESSASETRDLFSSLVSSLGTRSGDKDSQPNLNPQTLMMMLNLLSNLNKKKPEEPGKSPATTND